MNQRHAWEAAQAMSDACVVRLGAAPSRPILVRLLAHGEHETQMGASWPGENNVGACQERVPSAEERACLRAAGVVDGFANVDRAKSALEVAGLRSAGLHCDSRPTAAGSVPYFVYFRVFPTLEAGCEFFVATVTRAAAERAALSTPDVHAYAAALYAAGYYEGFHDPHSPGGREANVDDYARALGPLEAAYVSALAAWSPGAVYDGPAEPQVMPLVLVQLALMGLGYELVADGKRGPKTIAALAAFQAAQGLPATGVLDAVTQARLVEAGTLAGAAGAA